MRYLAEKTGRDIEYLNKFGSTRTCPVCGARNRPCGRDYRCKVCNFTCHRDALGAINILQKAIHGGLCPYRSRCSHPSHVFYLRDDKRLPPDQHNTHRMVQCRQAITLSSAQSQASVGETLFGKPKLANSSTSSLERVPLVAVA